MNISSTVKKLFIIAGLGLSVSAWASGAAVVQQTSPKKAAINAVKNAVCNANPWCGYQAGVSAATIPSFREDAADIVAISAGHCQSQPYNWLNDQLDDCAIEVHTTRPSCATLFHAIGNPCAPAGVSPR